MNVRYRRLVIILTALTFVGGLAGYRILSDQKAPPPRKPGGEAMRMQLQAGVVAPDVLPVPIPLQGRIRAYEKIDLFSEVNGLALSSDHAFREGVRYSRGEILVRLDDRESRLALQGQRAALMTALVQALPDLKVDFPERFGAWEAYVRQLNPEAVLPALPEPATDREKYFLAARNIQGQYYAIRSAEERLSKYIIRAPFDGALVTTDIHLGGLVRPGQRLGTFIRLGAFELETTVSLSDLRFIRIGQAVQMQSEDTGKAYQGRIVRIGDVIDPSTQMVPLFVEVQGEGLREGMYLLGSIRGSGEANVVGLPKELLINGREVWIIRDSVLLRQEVELVRSAREEVLIRGLDAGALYVRGIIPGMYEGMKVSWTIE